MLTCVTHFSSLNKIVIDVPAAQHAQELAFWQAATGQPLAHYERFPEYHGAVLQDGHLGLLLQRLEDSGPARVHVDIHTDDLEAEVARLEEAGATRVRQVNGWWVMRDPAGLAFCVIPDEPGRLTEQNAQRWD
jgi:predicted enzyme related to lactoylglutathione lyase